MGSSSCGTRGGKLVPVRIDPAIVLAAVKDEPAVAAEGAAIPDRHSTRRRTV